MGRKRSNREKTTVAKTDQKHFRHCPMPELMTYKTPLTGGVMAVSHSEFRGKVLFKKVGE